MYLNKTLLLVLILTYLNAIDIPVDIPKETKQLIIVTSDHTLDTNASLDTYEKIHDRWEKVFDPIPVVLGANGLGQGLGIGNGIHINVLKKEGDKRSPAGLFRLTHVFGYSKDPLTPYMPYLEATKDLHCVDDSDSSLYNQIVTSRSGYGSFENMLRDDELYKYGIVVAHNSRSEKDRGSCIFLHIAKKTFTPTSGCTAMREEDLIKIIKWLKSSEVPLLLQYNKDQTLKRKCMTSPS